MSATDETPPTQPDPAPSPRPKRRVARFVVRALAVLLVLVITTLATTWWWAGTPGSAAQAVGWAVRWMERRADTVGTLRTQGVEGSVRGGVKVAAMDWHRGALAVHAEGVVLQWDDALWLGLLRGRGVHPSAAHLRLLRITDTREPTSTEPLERLVLPLPVSLAFSVDRFERIATDTSPFTLSDIRGHYNYGLLAPSSDTPALPATTGIAFAHRLRLDTLQLADGRYQGALTLGAEAPMPMALDLQGTLPTRVPDGEAMNLAAQAQVRGNLGGAAAALDITAQVQGSAAPARPTDPMPSLALTARVMPWASQPLVSADANAQALNLAALWPAAPVTALSGRLQAQPDGAAWRASVTLANALPGPADQARLPLQSLSAEVEQRGVRWTVSDLRAELGGGTLKAQGAFDLDTTAGAGLPTAWQGQATASGVRPARLWSTLPPAALDAQASARAAPTASAPQAVELSARVTPSVRQPAGVSLAALRQSEVRVKGQWQPAPTVAGTPAPPAWHGLLQLAEAHIALAGAQLDAQGQLDTARLRHDGQGSLALPGLNLAWKGLASHAQGQGETTLQLASAARALAWVRSLQALPWVGEPVRQALAALGMQSAEGEAKASLKWTGGLGALGWPAAPGTTPDAVAPLRLEAALNAPRLALESDATGPLAFAGIALQAQGPLQALQVNAQGSATAAPWRASLDAAGQLRANAVLREGGQLDLSRLALRLNPVPNPADPKATATGWALESPQPLRIGWTGAPGQPLSLDAGTGTLLLRPMNAGATAPDTPLSLAWQRLRWQGASLETQGRLQGLSLPWVDMLAALAQPDARSPLQAAGLSGDLLFDAEWDVRLPADASTPPALTASLQRRSGSLRWRQGGGPASPADATSANGNGSLDAGVRDARVSLALQDRRWRAQLRWDTERLGQASAELNATVAAGGAPSEASLLERWWPANTPIQGSAQVRLPQVGVWSVLAPPGWRMQGTLNADATVAGTRGAPTWSGTLQADELALRSVADGIALTNGQLRATLAGDRIRVDRFSLQGPGGAEAGGTLDASGEATWRPTANGLAREPLINLQAKAQRLRVSNRPDRRLTLSGEINAQLEGALLRLRGQLKADSAMFILPDELAPTLGRDVIVRSTRTLPLEAGSAQRVQADVSIQLDLGPRFEVRGQGLQTRLEGQLTVQATPALPTPRVLGEVRTASGTYRAYDQQLNIESGALRFTGPYDDPALDIRAVRKLPANVEQRVGVQISGNAQAPRVSLFADPDMPEADKLAWLVLGRPASTAGAQAFVLQQAARRLLSQGGEPLDGALARTLGLDEIGFAAPSTGSDGTTTQAALTVGKRLSSDLYLSYEQSLAGAMSTVSILYDLSRRLTLRARAGTENAIDLIFTHRFD